MVMGTNAASRFTALFMGATAAASTAANASTTSWTDWLSTSGGSVSGTLETSPGSFVGVTFSGDLNGPTQTNGGTNYWRSDSIYRSTVVDAGPGESGNADILALTGQIGLTNTITFSVPVTNPVMAILSLGQTGMPVGYAFDQDFSILASGAGWWGGSSSGSLFRDGPGQLRGVEGHGLIMFTGTFTSISFTVSTPEYWHGIQIGAAPAPAGASVLALCGLVLVRRRRTHLR